MEENCSYFSVSLGSLGLNSLTSFYQYYPLFDTMSRGQSEKTYFKKNGICSHVCGTVKFRSAVNVLSQLFMYMPQQSSTMLN